MMKAILLLVCVAAASAVVIDDHSVGDALRFHSWTQEHGKKYTSSGAWEHAFRNFRATLKRVAKRNADPKQRAHFGVTKFADLSPAEFKAKYLNYKPSAKAARLDVAPRNPLVPPKTFNWNDTGALTPVKDQGQCGSCWAFSATENIESMWFLKNGNLPVLAPEQIVDCDKVDEACNGGDTPTAYAYVTQAGGMMTEESYPYTAGQTGQNGTCVFAPADVVAKINNFTYAVTPCFDSCSNQAALEPMMQAQLAEIGPFSICVNAQPWQDYSGGVMSSGCDGAYNSLDHCVQVIGYDWPNQYWIVRNSWNTNWGENGLIRLATNMNMCGIADEVTFANALKQ